MIFTILLTVAFSYPLFKLAQFALKSELNSHVFIVPAISLYLVWIRRDALRFVRSPVPRLLVALLLGLGAIALALSFVVRTGPGRLGLNDFLSCTTFSFVCFLVAGSGFYLGRDLLRALCFPVAFLLFLVPVPKEVAEWVSVFFQHTSASVAEVLFSATGEPVMRDGMVFRLPGLVLRVAEECSGIRSTYVLFITSLLAGYMFLRNPWKRVLLAALVIPLGIIRNAFRIFVIAMGTIHVNPKVIDSPLHHQGGPLFFIMSLVPFFVLLMWLRKSEAKRPNPSTLSPP